MNIQENIERVTQRIHEAESNYHRKIGSVQLIAVTKTHPPEVIEEAFAAGLRDFGENYIQELQAKIEYFRQKPYGKDIRWHVIGHVQSNKVRYIIDSVYCIHSVDSEKLLTEIQNRSEKISKVTRILLQVNVSGESSKSGCTPAEAYILAQKALSFPNISLCGLMTIGIFDAEDSVNSFIFENLANLLSDLRLKLEPDFPDKIQSFTELSMGMTDDYEIAISKGSTQVRIGSALFGQRQYL